MKSVANIDDMIRAKMSEKELEKARDKSYHERRIYANRKAKQLLDAKSKGKYYNSWNSMNMPKSNGFRSPKQHT